jgi:hypothetical protein
VGLHLEIISKMWRHFGSWLKVQNYNYLKEHSQIRIFLIILMHVENTFSNKLKYSTVVI